MFDRVLKFFIENSRMNYALFVLIFAIGIWSYMKTPKEIFPTFDLDMISINGSYTGASVDILDKMAVAEIEDGVKGIDGVDSVSTVVSPSKFSIVLELRKGVNRYNLADKIKDEVAKIKSKLPDDMDEPIVNIIERSKGLINVSLTSDRYSIDELKPLSAKFESRMMSIKGISDITIYGDSDEYYEILLDNQKIEAYGLNANDVAMAISSISYIFPIGKIDDSAKQFYISTYNGAKNVKDFQNTLLKIKDKLLYLKDLAVVSKTHEASATMYSFGGKNSLSMVISQLATGDAIQIAKDVKKLVKKLSDEYKDIDFATSDDNSVRIQDRLNVVVSNILFGIILITILVIMLINSRMALVIFIGIPTSFVISAIYLYFSGYTINMMLLVGVLLALGIVVDDAIVVSENIQQYIEKGMPPKEAAFLGAKEMAGPVTIASITTLFAFLPSLMISGMMGEVIKLIPIALSALLVASLIESFFFLPIHAAHTLKVGAKVTSWDGANRIYSSIIHFFMRWNKTFMLLFIVLVPILTFTMVKSSKFQMFPKFDSTSIKISIKANENSTLEESFAIVKSIEQDMMQKREAFSIEHIESVAGYRLDSGNNKENAANVMYMTVELGPLQADNPVDTYITPYLSFYRNDIVKTRTEESKKIAKKLKKFLAKRDYIEKYNLTELAILEKKVGPVKADIKLGLSSPDTTKIVSAIEMLESELGSYAGVKNIGNSLKFGIDEIKLRVNNYGQHLGLNERVIGSYLSNLYLSKKAAVVFDTSGMIDIKLKSMDKDSYESFKGRLIPLSDGTHVALSDVCDFEIQKTLAQSVKDNGETTFYVYANVEPETTTSTEVVQKLQATLKRVKDAGVELVFKGEAEKKKDLMRDMALASALAFVLIMLSLLYLFNSFRETFILMSVIPFSLLGALLGHKAMGMNLSMPSLIGALGLAGVVINDGIIMMTYLKKANNIEEIFTRSAMRFRPIILTTITTLLGMSSLIFFPAGEATIFQPTAVSIGFGLLWGTVLNLIYLPVIYTLAKGINTKSVR